jgi:hypothetical protein
MEISPILQQACGRGEIHTKLAGNLKLEDHLKEPKHKWINY